MKQFAPALTFAALMMLYAVHPVVGFLALVGAFAYTLRRPFRRAETLR